MAPRQHVGRQHALAVAQHRAAAPHGDAQVVEELRVDVVDRARQVGVDGREEVGEHEAEALDRRQCPGSSGTRRLVVVARGSTPAARSIEGDSIVGRRSKVTPVRGVTTLGVARACFS